MDNMNSFYEIVKESIQSSSEINQILKDKAFEIERLLQIKESHESTIDQLKAIIKSIKENADQELAAQKGFIRAQEDHLLRDEISHLKAHIGILQAEIDVYKFNLISIDGTMKANNSAKTSPTCTPSKILCFSPTKKSEDYYLQEQLNTSLASTKEMSAVIRQLENRNAKEHVENEMLKEQLSMLKRKEDELRNSLRKKEEEKLNLYSKLAEQKQINYDLSVNLRKVCKSIVDSYTQTVFNDELPTIKSLPTTKSPKKETSEDAEVMISQLKLQNTKLKMKLEIYEQERNELAVASDAKKARLSAAFKHHRLKFLKKT